MTGGYGFEPWADEDRPRRHVQGVPVEPSPFARGCLVTLALYAVAAAIIVVVWWSWPAGTDSPPPEPVPAPTIAPSYTRAPVTFPPVVDDVLSRAWERGGYACGLTGPAIDGLAAAFEREIADAPPGDARSTAARWVAEHCRG